MDWFRGFMMGRNGMDTLSAGLLSLFLLLALLARLGRWEVLGVLAIAPFVVGVLRIFSRDVGRRRAENAKLLRFFSPGSNWVRKASAQARDSKNHRFFKCPQCALTVRVPKGKGKIRITCPRCNTQFEKKT